MAVYFWWESSKWREFGRNCQKSCYCWGDVSLLSVEALFLSLHTSCHVGLVNCVAWAKPCIRCVSMQWGIDIQFEFLPINLLIVTWIWYSSNLQTKYVLVIPLVTQIHAKICWIIPKSFFDFEPCNNFTQIINYQSRLWFSSSSLDGSVLPSASSSCGTTGRVVAGLRNSAFFKELDVILSPRLRAIPWVLLRMRMKPWIFCPCFSMFTFAKASSPEHKRLQFAFF